jgi:branched-chain amino acid transport system permease protein
MLGTYLAFVVGGPVLAATAGLPPIVPLVVVGLVAALGTAAVGLTVERLVFRPLRGTNVLIPFIATAGVSIFLENSAQVIFGPDPVGISAILPTVVYTVGGVTFTNTQLLVAVVAIAILALVSYYVRGTRWGMATRAVAERSLIAASCGVDIDRVAQLTVAVSAATAAIGGVAVGLLLGSTTPTIGLTFGAKSFVCMLVAGNRHIEGIMVVGLALGITEALVAGYVSSSYRDAISYGLLIAVLVLRPRGLFGSYE